MRSIGALLATTVLGACAASDPAVSTPAGEAEALAREYLIVDTHIDVPYRLQRNWQDVGVPTGDGDFDYDRARRGGLNAPFMSIYIPARIDALGHAYSFANAAIDIVERIASEHPEKFAVATCTDDLLRHKRQGLMSLPMGMENGGPIEGSLEKLDHFFARGVRYVTLAHSKSNHISDSSYDNNKRWRGLSPFGKELIGEMNRRGMMVDVSHLSDDAFWQVLALSATPVLATHSSMRHFTPDFERNMTDAMVKAMAARGGVIHINFGSSFLHQPARDYGTRLQTEMAAYRTANGLAEDDPRLSFFRTRFRESNPYPFATLEDVVAHIERVVAVAGIDAVGIGSDYDGVGDSLPVGLKDAATYPVLVEALRARGFTRSDIRKLLGDNTLRVWRANEAYARANGGAVTCAS